MVKKILFGMLAFASLFATSCTNELEPIEAGNTSSVSFKVMTPAMESRAYSDGKTATVLQYAVYDAEGNILPKLTKTDGSIDVSTTVNLQLTTGNTYSVIFWAAAENAPYSVEFADAFKDAQMTVNYTGAVSNDENRDAFYKYHTFTVNGAQTETVELKRPFAQLNIGTADYAASESAGYTPTQSAVTVKNIYGTLNFETGEVSDNKEVSFGTANIKKDETFPVAGNDYLAMNYLLVGADQETIEVEYTYTDGSDAKTRTVGSVPVRRNYRTNIYGNLLTSEVDVKVEIKPEYEDDDKYGVVDGKVYTIVNNTEEFNSAFNDGVDIIILGQDINLNELTARSVVDPSYTVTKELIIDLNSKTLSATSSATGKNYNLFVVKNGNLTVKNGTIVYEHKGENMLWNSSTNIFHVEKATLNLTGVTAKNLGGSDMGFVAHLNNWGEVTLNVENSTLESNYVPIRVFNSGNDMNNVTIKNSNLTGVSAAFWVHNYTLADFNNDQTKVDAHKALLNLNIYNQGNKFSPDVNGIRYGFTNAVRADAYGITKSVSEDGTVVTLGSVVEDGLIRRGVAGTEENETIKTVIVGEGVTTLYDRTFRRYYALETVELPSTLTTIGEAGTGVFQSCSMLKNIVIPESVTVLGTGTFYGCTSLESINIPAGVTRIEENCLRETGLKEVEFHAGVTYFGKQAFRDCKQLTKVVINAPEFTIEPNAFGVMTTPYPGTTIYVANAEMKAYLESTLTYASQYIVVAPEVVENAGDLSTNAAEGKNVVLGNDLTDVAVNTVAPYGNKYGIAHNGGVIDGNNHVLDFDSPSGDNYGIMTSGGTIKNITIGGVFRGIMIMYPKQDIVIDNAIIGDEDVCYPINTGEGDGTHSLYVSNTTINGWNSYGTAIKDVTFKNCTFAQGKYYTNVYGRLTKPYVNAVYENCEFSSKYYIDLSQFGKDGDNNVLDENVKLVLKNCTVNGVKLTKDNWTSLIVAEDECGEGQISIELKDGSYLSANNLADYVVIE